MVSRPISLTMSPAVAALDEDCLLLQSPSQEETARGECVEMA